MVYDVLAAFIVFQISFFFLDIYIYSKTNRDIARKGEYTFFGLLIIIHMCYLFLNSAWTLQEYGAIHLPVSGAYLLVMLSLSFICGCAYTFFLFTIEKIRFRPLMDRTGRYLSALPVVGAFLIIFSSPWTGWGFRLDKDLHVIHGPLYTVMLVLVSLYLVFVIFAAGYNLVTAHTAVKRHSSGALLLSVLLIIVFVILDDMLNKASILPVAVFAVILVIFINMQESNIYSDALTGMNNRRKALDYLTGRLDEVSDESPLYLYMADLNKFKSINDVYGHAEGDEALIMCSNVLKHIIALHDGFAARYGGDEFLMSLQEGKDSSMDPEELICQINDALEEQSKKKPYVLEMTIGYTICRNRHESLASYLEKADAMLYERKRERLH